jgi:predicted Zn-dependent peptidase
MGGLDVQVTTLPNGLRVISSRMPHVASAAVGIWIGVGGRHEPARLSGVSHFIEHMVFKGTRSRTPAQISQEIEGRGGYFNAFTQEESTCYYGRILSTYGEDLFNVLADMYRNPLFPKDELEKERGVIVEEIMMYLDQPHHLVQDLLQDSMWHRHPLGRPLIGTEDIITSMPRKDLVDFKNQHYVPGNSLVVFAGQVDHDACVRQVRRQLGRARAAKPRSPSPVQSTTRQLALKTFDKEYEQTHLALGYRVFGRHDERRYALKIASILLGENMSSRLFQIIREKHALAYSIHSQVHLFKDSGMLSIQAGVDKEQAAKALKLILKEMQRLRETKVPARELARARDYAIGQVRMGLESSTQVMMWCGEGFMGYGEVGDPDEVCDKLASVQAEDILGVASKVLHPAHSTLAVVGQSKWPADLEARLRAL